jgi:regulatory protein
MTTPKSIKELHNDLFQPGEVDRFQDPKEARKKAMDYLARREYGQDELVQKLMTAGFETDVAADAVQVLADEGLQSDERYAGAFVRSRINQGKGPVRIRQELKERGLGGAVVDNAFEDAGADWYELAREVRVRKFGTSLPGDFTEKARQMRFLQYRGFESGQIQSAVSAHGDD